MKFVLKPFLITGPILDPPPRKDQKHFGILFFSGGVNSPLKEQIRTPEFLKANNPGRPVMMIVLLIVTPVKFRILLIITYSLR